MQIVDFSKCKRFHNEVFVSEYGGGDMVYGDLFYEDGVYSLKFGEGYDYGCYSEYIGNHIFDILGVVEWETFLGVIDYKGRQLTAVASRLANVDSKFFYNWFSILYNNSEKEAHGDISTFLSKIQELGLPEIIDLVPQMWAVLTIDAYIGNYSCGDCYETGLLFDNNKRYSFAPFLGCDKSLYAGQIAVAPGLMDEFDDDADFAFEKYENLLKYDKRGLWMNGEPLMYHQLFRQMQDVEGLKALVKIAVLIMEKENDINKMIDEIALLPDREKRFYKGILHQRLEKVLLKAIENNAVCKSFC